MAFIIPKRAMGLGDGGVRASLARVSAKWPRNDAGDFVFEKGFEATHLSALMKETPRGFHLLAQQGFIPVTEAQAVKMIFESGYTFEPPRVPVARVKHVDPKKSTTLMLLLLKRGYRKPMPKPSAPVKVFSV